MKSDAIQDAITALDDERTVLDQKITAVRDAVMQQLDTAIETLRELGGGARVKKWKKPLTRGPYKKKKRGPRGPYKKRTPKEAL